MGPSSNKEQAQKKVDAFNTASRPIRRFGRTMRSGFQVGKQLLGARKEIRESNEDYRNLKAANDIKGKPIEPADQSNPDFRIKVNAIHSKKRTEDRNMK